MLHRLPDVAMMGGDTHLSNSPSSLGLMLPYLESIITLSPFVYTSLLRVVLSLLMAAQVYVMYYLVTNPLYIVIIGSILVVLVLLSYLSCLQTSNVKSEVSTILLKNSLDESAGKNDDNYLYEYNQDDESFSNQSSKQSSHGTAMEDGDGDGEINSYHDPIDSRVGKSVGDAGNLISRNIKDESYNTLTAHAAHEEELLSGVWSVRGRATYG